MARQNQQQPRGQNNPGGGGIDRNLAVRPTDINAGEVKIKTKLVTRAGAPIPDIDIVIKLNGVLLPGNQKSAADGTAEFTITVPAGVTVAHIEAETDDALTKAAPIDVTVPQVAAPTAPDFTGYELYWQKHPITSGRINVHFVVRNDQGKSKAVKIRFTPHDDVSVNGRIYLKGQEAVLDLPENGGTWEIRFHCPHLNIDLFVQELNRHYKMPLHGPQPQAPIAGPGDGVIAHLVAGWEGQHPEGRFFIFWVPLFLFLVCCFGGWRVPALIVSIVVIKVAFSLIKGGEDYADRANVLFGGVMRTNNRWWATWFVTIALSFILSLLIWACVPGAPDGESVANSENITDQRENNLLNGPYHLYETDAEIETDIKANRLTRIDVPASTSEQPGLSHFLAKWLLPDQSISGWAVRILLFLLLGLITLAYAPIAFYDVAVKWYEDHSGKNEEGGKKHAILDFIRHLIKVPDQLPKTAGAKTLVESNIWRLIASFFASAEILEVIADLIRLMRGK